MVKIDEIVLATTNRGKLAELGRMLEGCSVKLSGLADFKGVGDVDETGSTFSENAMQKAQHYSKLLGRWVNSMISYLPTCVPAGKPTGLLQAQQLFRNINGIKFIQLSGSDIVRHELVQKIIEAYEKASHKR